MKTMYEVRVRFDGSNGWQTICKCATVQEAQAEIEHQKKIEDNGDCEYDIATIRAAPETKTATLRLPVQMVDELTANGAMLNPALVDFYNRARAEQKIKLLDIKGIFAPAEWLALVASFNGSLIDEYMRYSREMVIAHCEDAERYESAFSSNGADLQKVCQKVAELSRVQVATVLDRIEQFWSASADTDVQTWAIY